MGAAMAPSRTCLLVFAVACVMLPAATIGGKTSCPTFSPVLAFGDSTSDTGNAIHSITGNLYTEATRPPYGSTFFRAPTGRFSDGRLMVDFLASSLRLPLLPPHLGPHEKGFASKNFAVAGATAIDVETLYHLANVTATTPDSLGTQMEWFKGDTLGADLSNALVYIGEIGGNDYNYALLGAHHSLQSVKALIPPVIQKIKDSLEEILNKGVKKVVVQGEFPMGCISLYTKVFGNTTHDAHKCVAAVNELSDEHNKLLKAAVSEMTKKHKDVEIVFFDTSTAYLHILENATAYNFTNVHDPCCYACLFPPGPSAATHLGTAHGSMRPPLACPHPNNFISWDGIHLTEAMYDHLMNLFLTSSNFTSPFPNFLTSAISCK